MKHDSTGALVTDLVTYRSRRDEARDAESAGRVLFADLAAEADAWMKEWIEPTL